MAKIKVCDICKRQIDSRNHDGFRVKQNKLFMSSTEYRWIRGWEEIDLCEPCLNFLANMCKDHEFTKYAVDEWKKKKANK